MSDNAASIPSATEMGQPTAESILIARNQHICPECGSLLLDKEVRLECIRCLFVLKKDPNDASRVAPRRPR